MINVCVCVCAEMLDFDQQIINNLSTPNNTGDTGCLPGNDLIGQKLLKISMPRRF